MRTRLLAILLAASAAAFGADRDFDRLVSAVQIRFGTPPEHIPLMGFANFLVSVTKLAGTSGFRLAVFDNLRFCSYRPTRSITASCNKLRVFPMSRSRCHGEPTTAEV